jgi:hypothetical protein|tara:strand:+ start:2705 stop:2914 length:210 start_codon:yes stop_codon:yes gene_type:complete
MCSTITGQCPSSSLSGHQFDNHYDCVTMGYRVAYNTFLNLKELEEFERDYIEREKIVVKFECREIKNNA